MKPNVKIEQNGAQWSLTTSTSFRTHVIKFKLNEEFDEERADGQKVRATFKLLPGNKLMHTEITNDGIKSVITREVIFDQLNTVLNSGSVESVRIYDRD